MTNVTTVERSRGILGSVGGSSSSGVAKNTAHSSLLGFHCPCSGLNGGTMLGSAFLVSGSEVDRSRDYRTKTSTPQSPSSFPDSMANRKAIISKSRGRGVVRECIDSLSSKGPLHSALGTNIHYWGGVQNVEVAARHIPRDHVVLPKAQYKSLERSCC